MSHKLQSDISSPAVRKVGGDKRMLGNDSNCTYAGSSSAFDCNGSLSPQNRPTSEVSSGARSKDTRDHLPPIKGFGAGAGRIDL